MLSGCFKYVLRPSSLARTFSAQTKPLTSETEKIKLDVEKETGIVTLQMNKPAANSLNTEYFTQLYKTLDDIEKEKSVKGVIITSTLKDIFSAGLDITEMYQAKEDQMRQFWTATQDFWLKLYQYPLTTIAAINGHSPGAGSLIAMSCDYRIMAAKRSFIGLNETLLGLVAPYWLAECMRSTIGQRKTEQALQLGTLFSPEEALKVGLVDEIAKEEELMDVAKKELLKWIKISKSAKHSSKLLMRKALADSLIAKKDEDIENFVKFVSTNETQVALGKYFQSLKNKK